MKLRAAALVLGVFALVSASNVLAAPPAAKGAKKSDCMPDKDNPTKGKDKHGKPCDVKAAEPAPATPAP